MCVLSNSVKWFRLNSPFVRVLFSLLFTDFLFVFLFISIFGWILFSFLWRLQLVFFFFSGICFVRPIFLTIEPIFTVQYIGYDYTSNEIYTKFEQIFLLYIYFFCYFVHTASPKVKTEETTFENNSQSLFNMVFSFVIGIVGATDWMCL